MASNKTWSFSLLWVSLSLCLLSACLTIPPVDAVLVWSENFSAGSLPPEWTVLEGSFSCTNNRLEAASADWNSAYRASTVAEGEWRFDASVYAGLWVAFIAEDTTGTGSIKPQTGYILELNQHDSVIRLTRHVNGAASHMGFTSMAVSDHSIIVTRDSSGQFHVWVDGVHSISAVSTHVSTSANFIVTTYPAGSYIDNIAVYDEIITEYEDNGNGDTPPPIPGFPAVAIALGVVSALTIGVLYRRRQSPAQTK